MKKKHKMHVKRIFCFTGLPLSGKTHIAKIIADRTSGSVYISTGSIARGLIKDSAQQKEMEEKDLFPDEIKLRAELERQIANTTATCILIDGFPRSGEQVEYMVNTFNDLFPVVIDVNAGDMSTLAARARERGRDSRDANDIEFLKRLGLAMCNHNDVDIVVRRRLVPTYTIMSTGDEKFIMSQFAKIFTEYGDIK
jgi:adenylate kinase family enzyme